MRHIDISSLYELIADEFSSFPSMCLDHMSHMCISFRHEQIADELLDFFTLWPDSHMSHRDISYIRELIVGVFLRFLRELLGVLFRYFFPSCTDC